MKPYSSQSRLSVLGICDRSTAFRAAESYVEGIPENMSRKKAQGSYMRRTIQREESRCARDDRAPSQLTNNGPVHLFTRLTPAPANSKFPPVTWSEGREAQAPWIIQWRNVHPISPPVIAVNCSRAFACSFLKGSFTAKLEAIYVGSAACGLFLVPKLPAYLPQPFYHRASLSDHRCDTK